MLILLNSNVYISGFYVICTVLFVANRRLCLLLRWDSTSLISKSSPGEFEKIFISHFGQSYLKGQVKGYTTWKCTLEYLQKKLDDQQDADEEEQDTDEQVKRKRIDYDLLGDPLC